MPSRAGWAVTSGVFAGCLVACSAFSGSEDARPSTPPADLDAGTLADGAAVDADAAGAPEGGLAIDGSVDAGPVFAPSACSTTTCRLVFATHDTFVATSLGEGAAKADSECAARAAAVPELANRTFLAWIASQGVAASPRLKVDKEYRLTSGELVATSGLAMAKDPLKTPIARDERGLLVSERAWTGATDSGATLQTCSNWTNATEEATSGDVTATVGWSNAGTTPCSVPLHLYCIEQ